MKCQRGYAKKCVFVCVYECNGGGCTSFSESHPESFLGMHVDSQLSLNFQNQGNVNVIPYFTDIPDSS